MPDSSHHFSSPGMSIENGHANLRLAARLVTVGLGLTLAACASSPGASTGSAAPSGLAGQRVEAQQTLAAVSALATQAAVHEAQVQARIDDATAQAVATRDAYAFDVTATADTLRAAQNALQATQTAEAAEFSAHATVDSYNGAQAALALRATAQAGNLARQERSADLYASLGPLVALAGIVALFVLALVAMRAAWGWLESIERRRALVETRTGTILLLPSPSGLIAQVLARPELGNAPPDDEWVSEAPTADSIPVFQHGRFQTMLERGAQPDDPDRRLMLRLLRAAMLAVGPESSRLPGFRELGWPAETWTKAVALLKPHVVTQPGRSGGTFCESGATLRDLYNAVGERRITALPSPRLSLPAA